MSDALDTVTRSGVGWLYTGRDGPSLLRRGMSWSQSDRMQGYAGIANERCGVSIRNNDHTGGTALLRYCPCCDFGVLSCIACHAAYFFAFRSLASSRFRCVRSMRYGQSDLS